MQTRFWIQWRPIPGKAWVLVDARTERTVCSPKGHPYRFATPDEASVSAHRMAKRCGEPTSDD